VERKTLRRLREFFPNAAQMMQKGKITVTKRLTTVFHALSQFFILMLSNFFPALFNYTSHKFFLSSPINLLIQYYGYQRKSVEPYLFTNRVFNEKIP